MDHFENSWGGNGLFATRFYNSPVGDQEIICQFSKPGTRLISKGRHSDKLDDQPIQEESPSS
jgi:hypothetical protein